MPVSFDLSVLSSRRSANFVLASLIAILALKLLIIIGRSWRQRAGLDTSQTAQGAPDKGRLQVELITLTPNGYTPSQISRPKGKFLLVVDDRSGLPETSQKLERVIGAGDGEKLK